jgi:hypothetical protein
MKTRTSKRKAKTKPYWEMKATELAEATKQFDREMVIEESRPLSAAMRTALNKSNRRRGRPKVGKGARVISLSVESGLLSKADRLSRQLKISRAQLFAFSVRQLLDAHDLGHKRSARSSAA